MSSLDNYPWKEGHVILYDDNRGDDERDEGQGVEGQEGDDERDEGQEGDDESDEGQEGDDESDEGQGDEGQEGDDESDDESDDASFEYWSESDLVFDDIAPSPDDSPVWYPSVVTTTDDLQSLSGEFHTFDPLPFDL